MELLGAPCGEELVVVQFKINDSYQGIALGMPTVADNSAASAAGI
jgi:hypothetical protein